MYGKRRRQDGELSPSRSQKLSQSQGNDRGIVTLTLSDLGGIGEGAFKNQG